MFNLRIFFFIYLCINIVAFGFLNMSWEYQIHVLALMISKNYHKRTNRTLRLKNTFFLNKGLAKLQIVYTYSGLFYGRATAMEYGALAFILSNCEICE